MTIYFKTEGFPAIKKNANRKFDNRLPAGPIFNKYEAARAIAHSEACRLYGRRSSFDLVSLTHNNDPATVGRYKAVLKSPGERENPGNWDKTRIRECMIMRFVVRQFEK